MSLNETSVPALPRFVKLRFDKARDAWVLNAPERVLMLDVQGHAILSRIDGVKSIGAMVDELAAAFNAPRDEIAGDVLAFLDELAGKGFVHAN